MADKLETQRIDRLVLQQRVPDAYSASPGEHQWHDTGTQTAVDATKMTASEVFDKTAALLTVAPERNDLEYRVVLLCTETKGWIVQP